MTTKADIEIYKSVRKHPFAHLRMFYGMNFLAREFRLTSAVGVNKVVPFRGYVKRLFISAFVARRAAGELLVPGRKFGIVYYSVYFLAHLSIPPWCKRIFVSVTLPRFAVNNFVNLINMRFLLKILHNNC